ncbi:glutamine synthetase [Cyanobium sp. LEGE 06113]|uniref:glutamine synthetase n=1 Tax=Cyanobium sp. LEGE 06113 TaxID=1297573 RepID=UPI001D1544E7|nr:glutamine synthetase [Cyanobium sp. LEGE 06113]
MPCARAWAAGERRGLDGQPYALDQRSFCRRRQQTLSHQGLEALVGFEIEWMVGRTSPDGAWRPAVPGGPYGADRLVEGLDYLAAFAEALDGASLDWLQLHPEYGAGQFELSLAPGWLASPPREKPWWRACCRNCRPCCRWPVPWRCPTDAWRPVAGQRRSRCGGWRTGRRPCG